MQRFPDFVLQLADILSASDTLRDLLPPLADCLHQVADFEYLNLALHDSRLRVMRLYHVPELPGSSLSTLPVDDSVSGLVWKSGDAFLSPDLFHDSRFPNLLDRLRAIHLKSYCAVPLNTSHTRLGAIGVGSAVLNAYSPFQVRLLRRIGGLVAPVLDNMLIRDSLGEESARLQQLLHVGNAVFTNLQWDDLLPALARSLHSIFGFDYASVALHDPVTDSLHSYLLDSSAAGISPGRVLVSGDPAESAFREPRTVAFHREEIVSMPASFVESALQQGMQSLLCIPLRTALGVIGTLSIGSHKVAAFATADKDVLEPMSIQVAMSLDNARAYQRMRQLHSEIRGEPTHLADEVAPGPFSEILGNTRAIKQALEQTETVAASDATVLVLGETGTGKDLVARAVHRLSPRSAAPFIKMNCAAIPTGLLESEL
ncbi:MAG: sigma 54-interacting transcriptional regulator, partial [Acidobacteriales bacterium]|nr:sigma 54-interacting transcriptional regulator [Terriglobales bacterium]